MQQLSPHLPPSEPVGLLVAAVRRRLRQASSALAREFGLPAQQFWVLLVVLESERPSLGDLAQRLRMDQPTTSRVVARLVERGLLRVDTDEEDRRRACIEPAPAAEALHADLVRSAGRLRRATVAGLTENEEAHLANGLRKVLTSLDGFLVEVRDERRTSRPREGDEGTEDGRGRDAAGAAGSRP